MTDGCEVGWLDGDLVGCPEGTTDGSEVGSADGVPVGCPDGELVGWAGTGPRSRQRARPLGQALKAASRAVAWSGEGRGLAEYG